MSKNVLISGGSGLVGTRLTEFLVAKGYEVSHLSRKTSNKKTNTIYWDVENMLLDAKKIEAFDHIIHLAGAGIVDAAWTAKRKKELIDSRVKSAQLLHQAISENKRKPISFISASGIGYYGMLTSKKIFTEDDKAEDDFLGETCLKWEESALAMKQFNIPTSLIRIGVVLSKNGGALKEMAKPMRFSMGAALGTGKQYMSWIHIDDLCGIFIYAMENKLEGAFNAASPNPVNNEQFTKSLAKALKKALLLPKVPALVLKLILGSRAQLVLEGSRVSPDKILKAGFTFNYEVLDFALKDIYS